MISGIKTMCRKEMNGLMLHRSFNFGIEHCVFWVANGTLLLWVGNGTLIGWVGNETLVFWIRNRTLMVWVGNASLSIWVGNGTLVVWDVNGLLRVWVGNGTMMVWVCVRTEAERKLMMEERMELEEYQRKQNKIREEELEVRIGETLRNILFLRLKHKNCM